MTPPLIIGSSVAAVGMIATLWSKLSWRRRAVIAGAIAASVGTLIISWPSDAAFKAQRSRVASYCFGLGWDLHSFRTDLQNQYPPGTKLPPLSDPNWLMWNNSIIDSARRGTDLCVPDPETCSSSIAIPVGTTPEFMHALDVLSDAVKNQRSCPKP